MYTLYSPIAKARYKTGRGYDQWDTDTVVVHAQEGGVTACGIEVGTFRRGWLSGSWMRSLDVTCRRCRRVLDAQKNANERYDAS